MGEKKRRNGKNNQEPRGVEWQPGKKKTFIFLIPRKTAK